MAEQKSLVQEEKVNEFTAKDQVIKDIHLLLIFLTSWEEPLRNQSNERISKSWKGYLSEVLEDLENHAYITCQNNSRLITLTRAGIQQAQEIKQRFLIDDLVPDQKYNPPQTRQ